jgi:hypothetical protein
VQDHHHHHHRSRTTDQDENRCLDEKEKTIRTITTTKLKTNKREQKTKKTY